MEYEKRLRRKILCANCGKMGHEFKYCNDPPTSFGVINIKILNDTNESLILCDKFSTKQNVFYHIKSKKYNNIKCYISDNIKLYEDNHDSYILDNETIPYEMDEQIQKLYHYRNKILFMMVSRRFSLGFIEFIRGKYDVSDTKTIINLFEQMTDEEIKYIQENQYDDILYYFLNRNNEPKEVVLNRIYEGRYSNEYCEAKIRFNLLANSSDDDDDVPWRLSFYTKYIKPKWKKPEWGFPKGRRDKKIEENLSCACREFEEETGYKKNEYNILNKIEPLEERFIGTNGVHYKHIYYLAMNNTSRDIPKTDCDVYEIGDVKWFTYDEAMSHIRPYHMEKKRILTRIYLFVLNYLINNMHDL